MKKRDLSIKFLGYKITINQKHELLNNLISQVSSSKNLKIVFTPNPEQLVYARSHSSFAKVLGKADYLLPDGMGIIIGSQILSSFGKSEPILERITGVDVVSELLCRLKDKKILIIGGRSYQEDKFEGWNVVTASDKKKPKKGSKVLYWHEGFLNVSQPTKQEQQALINFIKKLSPDVVFVALGAPYQEEWIINNKKELEEANVRLAMVVGGAFDMLFAKVDRAPKWMQTVGLEWLFRLYKEPWRWRRQLNLLVFVKMIIQEVLN